MGRSLCSSALQGLVVVCWHCGFTDGSLCFTATVVLLGPHPDVTYLQFMLWTGFIHLICATYSDLALLFPVRRRQITLTVFVSSKHIVQSSRVYSMKIETFTSVDGKLWGFWCCFQSAHIIVFTSTLYRRTKEIMWADSMTINTCFNSSLHLDFILVLWT